MAEDVAVVEDLAVVRDCGLDLRVLQAQRPAKKANDDAIEVVGAFLDVKHVAGDALGYSLRLWKHGDDIVGLLSVYVGPPSDPPTGMLEDVRFDPRTRRFSFSAHLSTGLVYGRGYAGVPSRDRFTFTGVLTRKEVRGVLRRSDELFPGERSRSERIRLKYSKDFTELMGSASTNYAKWKAWADEMVLRHGGRK